MRANSPLKGAKQLCNIDMDDSTVKHQSRADDMTASCSNTDNLGEIEEIQQQTNHSLQRVRRQVTLLKKKTL